jgi:hypothetical protein
MNTMTVERTVDIPASHWLAIEVPPEVPAGKVVLAFTPVPADPFAAAKAKSKAAREKLRELCKDSKLTVDSFLAMKHADRVLEAAIEERAANNTL